MVWRGGGFSTCCFSFENGNAADLIRDYFKAITIVLVILAHENFANHAMKSWIHSFNMPAFFFVSGMLLKNSGMTSFRELRDYVGSRLIERYAPVLIAKEPRLRANSNIGRKAT